MAQMNMIPMVFHFAFFRGKTDWPWLDFHTLCLQSCLARAHPEKIVIHYDRDGEGPAWDAARILPKIEWRQVEAPDTINGYPVIDQRLWADIYRLRILYEEGGFYCDLDFVFLKNFEMLRHYPAIIGTQCKQKKKLACGLMGSIAGSTFIKAYLDAYKDWTPKEEKKVWTFANVIPWALSQEYAVHVLPRVAFYPVAWSNKTFWSGTVPKLKNSYALHLWETLHPELNMDVLMKTGLAEEIRKILGFPPAYASRGTVTMTSGFLTFQ